MKFDWTAAIRTAITGDPGKLAGHPKLFAAGQARRQLALEPARQVGDDPWPGTAAASPVTAETLLQRATAALAGAEVWRARLARLGSEADPPLGGGGRGLASAGPGAGAGAAEPPRGRLDTGGETAGAARAGQAGVSRCPVVHQQPGRPPGGAGPAARHARGPQVHGSRLRSAPPKPAASASAVRRSPSGEPPRDDLVRMLTGRLEYRAKAGDGGTLFGYAAVFNEWTTIDSWEGRFEERIAPGAFRKTLRERGDRVRVLFNHGMDPSIGDQPLGKPTVMREDEVGLYVEVPLDNTSNNADLKASLKSGALDGMSFRMNVVSEEWTEREDADPERTIKEIKLHEFGPVTFPAYEATQAGVRAHAPAAFEAWRSARQAPAPPVEDPPPPAEADPGRAHRQAELDRLQKLWEDSVRSREVLGRYLDDDGED